MSLARPTLDEIRAINAACEKGAGKDTDLQDNYFFHGFYHDEKGFYQRARRVTWSETGQRVARYLSRRQWIERNFKIKPKAGPLEFVELAKFPAQRRLEAMVLRQERARIPVRITQLKARQQGITTGVQADAFEFVMRGENRRALIIAHVDELARKILRMAHTARDKMEKGGDNGLFRFKMSAKATDTIVWDAPISGSITVTSAEKRGAGRGDTVDFLHKTEFGFWKEDKTGNVGVDESLPDVAGTYGFTESTANGDTGAFRDLFYSSWNERHKPLLQRSQPSIAMFFGWWEHPDYCWSKTFGGGKALDEKREKAILSTLDEEEERLLQRRYLKRWTVHDEWEQRLVRPSCQLVWKRKNVGWQSVSVDQLAWRRQKIETYRARGGLKIFNQEYPSCPEVAFISTGDRVFDPDIIYSYAKKAVQPLSRGTLVSGDELGSDSVMPWDVVG